MAEEYNRQLELINDCLDWIGPCGYRPSGADPGFWNGGGAWGVGDKLAVRSSQVCAPGGGGVWRHAP